MSFLRPKLPVILPLICGIGLLWALNHWKPIAKLEHTLFLFPERFEQETIFSERGPLHNFQVTPLKFVGELSPRSLSSYIIDEETREIIDLSPEKWAYFLETIQKNNEGLLIITAPLSWPDASELSLETLDYQISKIPNIVIGLDAEFNNTSKALPPYLKNSVISSSPLKSFDLPTIDHLTLPPSVKAPLYGISTIQGFIIESTSKTLKVPMMVRWGDSVLPSTHLAALIASQNLTPKEIIIDPSGYLRIGSDGPILKVDTQGRANFPNLSNSSISASQILIYPEKASSSKIIHPANPPKVLGLLETHFTQALSQNPKPLKTYQRWSLQIEIAALILFTLILQARRLWLTFLGIAAILIASIYFHHWFPATPLALVFITFSLTPKHTPKAPKNELSKSTPQERDRKVEESKSNEVTTSSPKKTPSTQKAAPKKTPKKAAKKNPRKQVRRKKKKRR